MKRDQHFMTDEALMNRMVRYANLTKEDCVLEIGAGDGRLTRKLAEKATVIAIEQDKETVVNADVTVVYGNALKILKKYSFTKIVSNVPYSISEPLIRKLAYLDFERAVLTLPIIFVQSLTKRSSLLSIFAQAFFTIEIKEEVPKTAFHPKPRTHSVCVILQKKKPNIQSTFLSFETKKVKNALETTLTRTKKITKKEAKEIVGFWKLSQSLQEKKVRDLREKELKKILTFIKAL